MTMRKLHLLNIEWHHEQRLADFRAFRIFQAHMEKPNDVDPGVLFDSLKRVEGEPEDDRTAFAQAAAVQGAI